MTSKMTVDLSDPNLADAFRDCEVGQEETLTSLTFVPTSKTGNMLEANITAAEPPESYDEEEEQPEEMPVRGKHQSNLPPMMVMVGMKPRGKA